MHGLLSLLLMVVSNGRTATEARLSTLVRRGWLRRAFKVEHVHAHGTHMAQ